MYNDLSFELVVGGAAMINRALSPPQSPWSISRATLVSSLSTESTAKRLVLKQEGAECQTCSV